MFTTTVAVTTEESGPIFTFAGDANTTTTTDSYGFADTQSVYSNQDGSLSSMIAGVEGNELLRILSQREPRVADTAPTPNYSAAAEMEDFWTSYRMNRSEISANDDSSVHNYFTEYSRADGPSSGTWTDVNANRQTPRQSDIMDSFDFLIKSLSSANNFVSMLTREQLAVLRAIRPSLLYELLQEVAKARSDRRIRRALPTECAFCKNNGENEECYTQHALKDWRGRVLCPVLRAFHCPRCGATGDRAHTIKYCPEPADLGGSSLASRRRVTPSTSLLLGEPSSATRPLSTPVAPSSTPVSSPVNTSLSYSTLWSNFNNFNKK